MAIVTRQWDWRRGDKPPAIKLTFPDGFDLTGSEFLCQVRKRPGSTVLAELPIDETESEDGIAWVRPTAEHSEAVGAVTSHAVYDVEWRDSLGVPLTVVEGQLFCVQDVSRDG